MTQQALEQSQCAPLMGKLPNMVGGVDGRPLSQDPDKSFWHAMRDGTTNQTVEEATQLTQTHIDTSFARSAANCSDLSGLADALHAEQDKYSPSHRGYQPWYGIGPTWRFAKHVLLDIAGAVGPVWNQAVGASRTIVQQFKQQCPCQCR